MGSGSSASADERAEEVSAIRVLKLAIVGALNQLCIAIDKAAYRPAVIRLTRRLPRWWHCQLALVSIALDKRWQLGYWDFGMQPDRPCEACRRRPAYLEMGGKWDEDESEPEDDDEDDYLAQRVVDMCGWCYLTPSQIAGVVDEETLQQALKVAGERSMRWVWTHKANEADRENDPLWPAR